MSTDRRGKAEDLGKYFPDLEVTQGICWDAKNFSPSHISNLHILCCLSYICVFVFVFTHPQLANPYLLLCHSSSLWWQGGQLVFGLPEFSAFIGLFQVILCTPCFFCEYFSHLAFWNVNVFLVWQWATVERKEGPKRSLEIGCTLSLVGHSCNGTTSQSGFLGTSLFLAFMAGKWHFEEDIVKYFINTTNSMPCMMLQCYNVKQ